MQIYKVTGTIWHFDAKGNRQWAQVAEMEVRATSNNAEIQYTAMKQWCQDNGIELKSVQGWGGFNARPLRKDEIDAKSGATQPGLF